MVLKNVEDMATKDMTLTVQSGAVACNLTTDAIDMASLKTEFPGVKTEKITFDVTIKNSSVKLSGTTLVVEPVEFTIMANYDGKSVQADTFSTYVDRTIEVSTEQAKKITTAIVTEPDGSQRHVPTGSMEKNGKYYAVIKSMTNSTYTVISIDV